MKAVVFFFKIWSFRLWAYDRVEGLGHLKLLSA